MKPDHSSLGRLLRRLSLKPYGDELLTRSGDFWIFSARLIVFTMAAAEALAWGYMGSLMSRGSPLITAAVAAVFVFTLIWIIDASFVTLDTSRAFYEGALTGKRINPLRERLKLAGGVAARVAIVTASLFITAPFLAQAILAGDVADEMQRRNAESVAGKRRQIERPFVSRIDELRREQKRLEEERVKEAAGVGPSGRYGRGPALETIERQLAEKVREIAAAESARTAALSRFDRLSRAELEQQHGVHFLAPGVHSSAGVLDELLSDPQFTAAERAVRAFLAFLFIGLLILKAFQPRSVAVYYNEQLHSIFDDYNKGLFDAYLPEPERSRGGSIDPLRFEEWCLGAYAVIRGEDERRRKTASEYRAHELLIEQWRQLEDSSRRELEPVLQRYDAALAAIHALEEELDAATISAARVSAELQNVEDAHRSMLQHLEKGGMDGATFERAVAAAKDLEERRRTLALSLTRSQAVIESSRKRIELRKSDAATLREEVATQQKVIADAQKRIAGERMNLAEIISSYRGERGIWAGGDT